MAEFQSGLKCFQVDDDEGEKISKMLEQAAEPEVIMADMSLEQLTSYATYQAKVEVYNIFISNGWSGSKQKELLNKGNCQMGWKLPKRNMFGIQVYNHQIAV